MGLSLITDAECVHFFAPFYSKFLLANLGFVFSDDRLLLVAEKSKAVLDKYEWISHTELSLPDNFFGSSVVALLGTAKMIQLKRCKIDFDLDFAIELRSLYDYRRYDSE